jgi:ABC-type multidrug transport system ATPase subunit
MKETLVNNDLIITKADKGKTVVIMEQNTRKYEQFIQEFLIDNKYTTLQHDPTKQCQRSIMNINTCNMKHKSKTNIHFTTLSHELQQYVLL